MRKLRMLNNAAALNDLHIPSAHRLEAYWKPVWPIQHQEQ